jgi:hypothetical protein
MTTAQYTIWMIALVALTFAAGCSVGNTFRKIRTPTKAPNAKSRNA